MIRTSAGSTDTSGYPARAVSMACLFRDRVTATPAGLLALGVRPGSRPVDDDELTPGLKVGRTVVESRYQPLLDSMYDGQRSG